MTRTGAPPDKGRANQQIVVADGTPPTGCPPGWYSDPAHLAPLRYWAGDEWTEWASDGAAVWIAEVPVRRTVGAADADHLRFVMEAFVPEARMRGLVTDWDAFRLSGLAHELLNGLAPSAQPETVPAAGTTFQPFESPTIVTRRPAAVAETVARVAPATVDTPWRRLRRVIGADLAVHGLAYVGVLLFFVGVFGLVAFSFADVRPGLRVISELFIAAGPLAAAALLVTRHATIVGRALELCGGLLLPVAVMTMFLDGVSPPADLTGAPLVVVLTASCGVVAAGYAGWSLRHRDSMLRHLVAPVIWLAVAMATLGVGRTIPSGKDVAVPNAGQLAVVLAAVVASMLLARLGRLGWLSAPTAVSAIPGTAIVAVLAMLTWGAHNWPPIPILITAVLVVGALELLAARLPAAAIGVIEAMWWSIISIALAPAFGRAAAAGVAVVGFICIVELSAAMRRPWWTIVLPAVAAAASIGFCWQAWWWAFGVILAATVWSGTRRLVPFALPGAPHAFDIAAGVLPLAAVAALGAATNVAVAAVAASGLLALVTVPATHPVLRRGADDPFWLVWWWVVLGAASPVAAGGWQAAGSTAREWMITAAAATLALACAAGPAPWIARPWLITGTGLPALLAAAHLSVVPAASQGVAIGTVGLALVVAANHRDRWDAKIAGSVGWVGHAVAVVALAVAGTGWGLVGAAALATAGWAITAARDVDGASPVVRLGDIADLLQYVPCAVVAVGLPSTIALTLDLSHLVTFGAVWAPTVAATTAVVYAALTRPPVIARIGGTLAWAAYVAALGGSILARVPGVAAVDLGCLIVSVVVLAAARRHLVMTWTAWAAIAPLAGVLAVEYWDWFAGLPQATEVTTTLVCVGGAMAVGAAAVDTSAGWVPRWRPRRAWLNPVVVLGGGYVIAALSTVGTLPRVTEAVVLAVAAGAALATSVLGRAGVLGGAGLVLGWLAVVRAWPDGIAARAWIPVLVAAVLISAGALLARILPERTWWSRWDLPVLVVAVPVGSSALVAAADGDFAVLTHLLLGVEALGVAVLLRRFRELCIGLAAVGVSLILLGAAEAGRGWLALGLLMLSAAFVVAANRVPVVARSALQAGALLSASAAWFVGLSWLAWSAQQSVDATACAGGAVALASIAAGRFRRMDRSWMIAAGGVAAVVTVAAAIASERALWQSAGSSVTPSAWVAAGVGLLSVALVASAGSLQAGWLLDLGAGGVLATAGLGIQAGHAAAPVQVALWVALGLASAAALAGPGATLLRAWGHRPVVELGVVAITAGLGVAAAQLPERPLLVTAFAAASAMAAATGTSMRIDALRLAAPLLAGAAWITFASEALAGNAQWLTAPIGIALLVVVELLRRTQTAQPPPGSARQAVVGVELLGLALIVGPSLVQAVTQSIGYAVLALGLSICFGMWGTITKVRRRVASATLLALTSIVILVAVPLVGLAPAATSATLWITLACVGLAAVLAAALLENTRTVIRMTLERLRKATRDWE